MEKLIDKLSASEYELLNKCIFWHIRPHRQVLLEGLFAMSKSLCFDNLNVLELGATANSALSPFLVARGANSVVTCFEENELSRLGETLSRLSQQYGLARERFQTMQADVFALDQKNKYDLILFKGVLGGVCRDHGQAKFRKAVENCLSVLKPNGQLLIIDKARSFKVINWLLRKFGTGGKYDWHYFTFDEIEQLIPKGSFKTSFAAYGILSFADLGGGILQKAADFLDEHCVEKFVSPEKRVVFSLSCVKE